MRFAEPSWVKWLSWKGWRKTSLKGTPSIIAGLHYWFDKGTAMTCLLFSECTLFCQICSLSFLVSISFEIRVNIDYPPTIYYIR